MHRLTGRTFAQVVDRHRDDHPARGGVLHRVDQGPIRPHGPTGRRRPIDDVHKGSGGVRLLERLDDRSHIGELGGGGGQQAALHGDQMGGELHRDRLPGRHRQAHFDLRAMPVRSHRVRPHTLVDGTEGEIRLGGPAGTGHPGHSVHHGGAFDHPGCI